ncbi:MAG: PQQ-dependent sugar dehydrogenase, partial [Gemmatimonas sp.]
MTASRRQEVPAALKRGLSVGLLTVAVMVVAVASAQSRPPARLALGCRSDNAGLTLPAGFCAGVFADSLGGPRHMAVAPNGDVFVVRQSRLPADSLKGGVVGMRDTDKDGQADMLVSFGPVGGTGIAVDGAFLYVDARTAILRYPLPVGMLAPTDAPDTIVKGLPTGGHAARNFVLDGKGSMYVNIGSRTNSCQEQDRQNASKGVDPCVELETRAGIWKFSATRIGQQFSAAERFATGIRNAVGMTWNSAENVLYATAHGRDQLLQNWAPLYDEVKSATQPAEALMRVSQGDDYGWPYCYFDTDLKRLVLAPEYGGDAKTAGRCKSMKNPLVAFPGHWAPNGVAFYTGGTFPARFRSGAFIAFHGSWNRAPQEQAGYKVVFVPSRSGRFGGAYETFADGFANGKLNPSTAEHRPTGLAITPDGALLISDDKGGRIYRVQAG